MVSALVSPFPLPFMFAQLLKPRERRTVAIAFGTLVSAAMLGYVVMPAAQRWKVREAAIDAAGERIGRLEGLRESQENLVTTASTRMTVDAPVHVIRGRTPALAASSLQAALREYARLSRVSITRLDVAQESDSVSGRMNARGIPATISAVTDIYGLADFLSRIQQGVILLKVEELTVAPNPVLRGDLLQISIVVRAPFILEST